MSHRSWERSLLCPLLLDLRFLHYFNASWWGHFVGMDRKHAAIPNEAKEAEDTVRQSLREFLAEVAAGPAAEGRRGSNMPPPLTNEERSVVTRAVRAVENYAMTFNHKEAFGLADASVTDAGAASLALALPGSRVGSLLLSGNMIGDAGAVALAAALPDAPNLRELVLSGNAVGEDGAKALLNALPKSGLEHIDLCGGYSVAKGRITDATKKKFRQFDDVLYDIPACRNRNGDEIRFS